MSDKRKDRTILHCDCNNFFASVELRSRPELRDVPVAVAGDTDSRHGIILAKNMPAKKLGIVTAETVWSARKKCPELILLPPHHPLYRQVSSQINALYLEYTDQVEPFSVDESWLDVTGSLQLFGSGHEIADTLRRRVREEIGITISVGVSFNKTWAKMGSDYRKPDATTVLSRATAPEILYPQPVDQMLFVGKSTAEVLHHQGIHTIGDMIAAGKQTLSDLLGKSGEQLWISAAGYDSDPVRQWGDLDDAKSISHSETYAHDLTGTEVCHDALLALAERVGQRLRAQHLKGMTISIQIKDPKLKVINRQTTLESPTASTEVIFREACRLYDQAWDSSLPVRLLSVGISSLMPETSAYPAQLSLFQESTGDDPRRLQLEKVIDGLQDRFGSHTIARGRSAVSSRERKS